MNWTCYASLPKDYDGLIDLFEVIRMMGKFDMPLDLLYDLEPYEFILYLEGKLESQREFFEFMCYSLYSSVGQLLSGKNKKFENPFGKPKEKVIATKTAQEKTMDTLQNIFGVEIGDDE